MQKYEIKPHEFNLTISLNIKCQNSLDIQQVINNHPAKYTKNREL